MNNILQRIEQLFNDYENRLIGNFDFSEDEYSLMVDSIVPLCDNLDKDSYKLIFVTLVEIAKRWKDTDAVDESDENLAFWNFIFKTLTGTEEFNQKLYNTFTNVISEISKQNNIPTVETGKKYYATLMMHAFTPKNSIHSFFDLCYNVYKKDLDFSYTNDDKWLCDIVATELSNILSHGYREDKNVSIGSSAYSIKIGLRSFALNNDLKPSFVNFISDTFYQINQLFNREKIEENTRLKRYIVEWWKNKTEIEKTKDGTPSTKRRMSTVSKQNIVAKYIRENENVFLCIPPIRLDDENINIWLTIFTDNEIIYSEEMWTKRGELVVATKQFEKNLNDLVNGKDILNLKVELKENGKIIFDSEKNKTTSLYREFILFEDDKEIFSQINKPTNYFVYSTDIDGLRNTPKELNTYSKNLYCIYPIAGESLISETRQVFFVNKEKAARLGNTICLIGNLVNVEWLFDEFTCIVYGNSIKLMIPETMNLKALELRIDRKTYKLDTLKYEQKENNSYQFGLKALGLITKNEPTEISVFSYEKDTVLFSETIISLPNLEVNFNHSVYYGERERKLTIKDETEVYECTWDNHEYEVKCPYKEGFLLVKIPYFKWRISNTEWNNEPINRKLWYQDILQNGDLLEINNPIESKDVKVFCSIDEETIEVTKNRNGKFEIGRVIYANENKNDIFVYFINEEEKLVLFNVATKEHFVDNPLIYSNGKVFWNIENTFVGKTNNEFFLIMKGDGNNIIRTKIGEKHKEFTNISEDIYQITIKIKDNNIFLEQDNYITIYENCFIVGKKEQFKFYKKRIVLDKIKCVNKGWLTLIPKYFIDNLKYIEEDDNIYYIGKLCVIDKTGTTKVLNNMINEKGTYDKTNPVRIELRNKNTLWLVAGWEGGNDFIGNLFCDKRRKGICNIQKQDNRFDEINLYIFKEEEYV